jgi:hypothetical protein
MHLEEGKILAGGELGGWCLVSSVMQISPNQGSAEGACVRRD